MARQGDGYCVVESAGDQLASDATHPPLSPSRFSWSECACVYRLVNALTLWARLPSDDIPNSTAWFTISHRSSTHDYNITRPSLQPSRLHLADTAVLPLEHINVFATWKKKKRKHNGLLPRTISQQRHDRRGVGQVLCQLRSAVQPANPSAGKGAHTKPGINTSCPNIDTVTRHH
jgi:hypothetical protein